LAPRAPHSRPELAVPVCRRARSVAGVDQAQLPKPRRRQLSDHGRTPLWCRARATTRVGGRTRRHNPEIPSSQTSSQASARPRTTTSARTSSTGTMNRRPRRRQRLVMRRSTVRFRLAAAGRTACYGPSGAAGLERRAVTLPGSRPAARIFTVATASARRGSWRDEFLGRSSGSGRSRGLYRRAGR
jgi:hypothetical protein